LWCQLPAACCDVSRADVVSITAAKSTHCCQQVWQGWVLFLALLPAWAAYCCSTVVIMVHQAVVFPVACSVELGRDRACYLGQACMHSPHAITAVLGCA
jgi:hypothetical protein